MAFPTPSNFTTHDGTVAGTTLTVGVPGGGSAPVGTRHIIALGMAVTGQTMTPPASGTVVSQLVENTTGGTNGLYVLVYDQQASEATIDIGCTVSTKFATGACSVTGDNKSINPEISTGAIGANGPPNPDAITPTGGSKDYLFVACGSMGGEIAMTAGSTNYTNFQEGDSGTGGAVTTNTRAGICVRQLTTAGPEDPGVWTGGDATQEWAAMTVVFHPFVPGTAFPFRRKNQLYVPQRDLDPWSAGGWQ